MGVTGKARSDTCCLATYPHISQIVLKYPSPYFWEQWPIWYNKGKLPIPTQTPPPRKVDPPKAAPVKASPKKEEAEKAVARP